MEMEINGIIGFIFMYFFLDFVFNFCFFLKCLNLFIINDYDLGNIYLEIYKIE